MASLAEFEARVIYERLFRWAAEGRSLPSVVKALRGENAPTRNGGAWRPSTIRGCCGTASTPAAWSSTATSSAPGTTPSYRTCSSTPLGVKSVGRRRPP